MAIAPFVIKAYGLKAREFEKATRNPMEHQKRVLMEIVSRNKFTVYGKEHGFESIKSVENYRERVGENDYVSLSPYIERLTTGKENILTRDKTVLFGITSGTTGKPKYLPVTNYSVRKKREVMDIWTYYILKDHPGILSGKVLAIVSPEIEGHTTCGVPFGAESGHAYKNMPNIIKNLYVLPYEVFEISDYDARYYCILRIALEANITVIATLNPSTILLLCQRLDRLKSKIIDEIREGTLAGELNIRYDIRKAIERMLKPNPERADELEGFLGKKGGRLLPSDLWPKLEIITCWKGGSVGSYISHLNDYFDEKVSIRDFGYLSSEARCSIPLADEGHSGVLAVTGNFYEFLLHDTKDKGKKRYLLADELEADREYYVILTTYGGLYRYNIDDIIKVTGFFNRTPVVEFRQKGSIVSSVTGEKIYERHIDDAVSKAARASGVTLQFFSAFVEWKECPRYAIIVELINESSASVLSGFLERIENELSGINVEYCAKRRSQRLGPPVLKIVSSGTLDRHRSKKVSGGCHDGQFKLPKLATSADFHRDFTVIEEIKIR